MRLWSIAPEYLDRQGLVALWRETLLARKVLLGQTKGYKNHPQLTRFRNTDDSIGYINQYLDSIYLEARRRGYNFDAAKISLLKNKLKDIKVSNGQINYEFNHLLRKLETRDFGQFSKIKSFSGEKIKPNRIFKVVEGKIEDWEQVKPDKSI